MPKILLIRFSAIGDIVWSSPLVRCLKEQLPNCYVHICTKAMYAEMWEANPYVDKLHLLGSSLVELIGKLRRENFDYVIDLHKNLRSTLIKLLLGKKSFTYNKLTWQRFLLTQFQIDRFPRKPDGEPLHIVERYMNAAAPLGIVYDGKGLDYFIAPRYWVDLQAIAPALSKQPFCAYVIGGSAVTKKLPLHKMAELCQKLPFSHIALIGGKEDVENAEKLIKLFADSDKKIISFCGKLSISQSASVVAQASFVIGHDTGLTHIAAAFHKTVYSIWGSTISMGFKPFCPTSIVLENNQLPCRPCSKSGARRCPRTHFKCMNELAIPNEFPLPDCL
ncbi:MAG: glycosyltransferase family 9 protein [Cytophagales bacterium]|nr:glycosyltransferase family 9 protein [Bernardetiaceae bacterium]MDW8210528.1 glycosyltransferase family 9 protein [Cytophagales bacterium]